MRRVRRAFRAGATLGALLLMLFAALPARADVAGLVRGHVTVDGIARLGVTVTISGEASRLTTQTDAAGNFTIPRVPFGHYLVTAHLAGKPDAIATIDVSTGSVTALTLSIGTLPEIGRTTASNRGIGGTPVSENTLGRTTIEGLPQSQSLDRLIETVPGIVRFSYDEPVAHGFHGVTYEVDGAPVPQTTSANFSELIDPRNIDSLEIFTGAFPAEFGGQRQGAVINIVTSRDTGAPGGTQAIVSPGAGSYDTATGSFAGAFAAGSTRIYLNANGESTSRGLDAPTRSELHDDASLWDVFLRTSTPLGPNDTLAFDWSNQYNAYQIPINTAASADDPIVNVPGQDDVQREYNRFANLNFTHTSRDGNGFLQVIPWYRYTRVVYAGDLANAVLALDYNPDDCAPAAPPCPLAGLSQDRAANAEGIRTSYFRSFGAHALKVGAETSVENFTSAETILLPGEAPFLDNVAQRGSAFAAYAQDKWTPSRALSFQLGLRYDRSSGFVSGSELQPRAGVNLRVGPQTTVHAYYGRIYAAPALEDTRRDAVIAGGGSPADALPVYDLKPEHDSYYEIGLAHTFGGGLSGYLNGWERNAWNVLDTTQIFPTPIFAVFNNALGLAHGLELRLEQRRAADFWYLSASYSQSVAGGISGATFLFPPDVVADTSLNPEDHDQALAVNGAYTKRFGPARRTYATLGAEYGTGYPVQFQNGAGRLPPHLTFDAALGRVPAGRSLGFSLGALNFTNHRYLVKVENGFNTTQWAPGAQVRLQLQAPL